MSYLHVADSSVVRLMVVWVVDGRLPVGDGLLRIGAAVSAAVKATVVDEDV